MVHELAGLLMEASSVRGAPLPHAVDLHEGIGFRGQAGLALARRIGSARQCRGWCAPSPRRRRAAAAVAALSSCGHRSLAT